MDRPTDLRSRSTQQVLADHLQRRERGELKEDLEENYSREVIVLCQAGVLHGREGVRQSADYLDEQLPEARFKYPLRYVEDNYAYLT